MRDDLRTGAKVSMGGGCMGLVGLIACDVTSLRVAAMAPVAEGAIVAVFPPDGARRLSGEVPVRVVLGDEATGLRVRAEANGTPLACALRDAGVWADCGEVDGGDLDIRVAAGAGRVVAQGEAALPDEGPAWDLLDDGASIMLGGVGSHALDGHLVVVLDGDTIVGGAAQEGAGGGLEAMAPGLSLVMAATEKGGAVTATADTAWLTARVDDAPLPLLVLDARLDLAPDGRYSFVADVPALSVVQIVDATGHLADLSLDVDRDGDGAPDAASLSLSGLASPVTFAGWSPPDRSSRAPAPPKGR